MIHLLALIMALTSTTVSVPVDLTIPPCPTEDSNGCYWDASTRGNGLGHSFIATNDGEVIWLDGWTCDAPVGMDYLCDEEG